MNILLIEDNEDDVFFIRKALRDERWDIRVMSDGQLAFEMLSKAEPPPDVVLLDFFLPRKNALEILTGLGERVARSAFVVLTVDNRVESVREALKAGALDFVVKSANLKNELPGVIRKAWRTREHSLEGERFKRRLAESEFRYKTLVDHSMTGIGLFRFDGKVLDINPAMERISGYSREEFLNIDERRHYCDIERREELLEALREHGHAEKEVKFRRANGSVFDAIITATLVEINGEGAVLTNVMDITERKRSTEELKLAKKRAEASDRLKTSFLANLSHEVRTPLNGVMGFAEILARGDLTDSQRLNFFMKAQRCGDALLNIINDVLDMSQLESGQIRVDAKPCSLDELMREANDIAVNAAEAQGKSHFQIRRQEAYNGLERWVTLDGARVLHVFKKLISNAIKFTEWGVIEIGCAIKSESWIEFHVRDTGVGIPPEKQAIIFERFRQGDDSFTRNYGGSGLGLTIAKRLVVMMGGDIRVESDVGQGATFYFTAPYRPTPRASA